MVIVTKMTRLIIDPYIKSACSGYRDQAITILSIQLIIGVSDRKY